MNCQRIQPVQIGRIYRIDGKKNLKAFVDLVFFNGFIVKGIKVFKSKKGLYLRMPQTKTNTGRWYRQSYPVTDDMRELIKELVFKAYYADK